MKEPEDKIETAWANYHAGHFQAVLDLFGDQWLEGEALKILGLAHFQLLHFDAALDLLHRFAKVQGDYLDWFSVSTTAAMAKSSALALEAFDRCCTLFPQEGPKDGPSLAQLHWYFMKAMVEAGFEAQLLVPFDYLVACYSAAKITDPQYLLQRDLPFWEDFLEVARPILRSLPLAEAQVRVDLLSKAVDAAGRGSLKGLI